MAMSKKDYVAVARAVDRNIEDEGNDDAYKASCRLAERLADVFAADNPRFDRAKFLAACGVA